MMEKTDQPPDPLEVLKEEARVVAQFFGVTAYEIAAQMIVNRFEARLGGQRIYIGKARGQKTREQAAMRAQYRGKNLDEIARLFGKSKRQTRRIVTKKDLT